MSICKLLMAITDGEKWIIVNQGIVRKEKAGTDIYFIGDIKKHFHISSKHRRKWINGLIIFISQKVPGIGVGSDPI